MSGLLRLVSEELSRPVDPRITAAAAAIAANHGDASRAVLFYGSSLREQRVEGLMLDFYLIVSDYRSAYKKRWLALANRFIPPNVFYFENGSITAKYAVLSEADFAHECSSEAWTVSTTARFAQPSRLVWSANRRAADHMLEIISRAAPTLLGWTASVARSDSTPLELWEDAFALTFGAELRAERSNRSSEIVNFDPERYRRFAEVACMSIDDHDRRGRGWWRGKQRRGKISSVARLAKASLTFSGGADYIASKINRHAGTRIRLKDWHRKHPLIAGISLLPRLLKSGAVR